MSYIIDQSIFLQYIKKSVNNESLELECVFDSNSINKDTFIRILESLKSVNDFINEETSGKTHEVTKQMGYISNVEDARKKLEDLFKDT